MNRVALRRLVLAVLFAGAAAYQARSGLLSARLALWPESAARAPVLLADLSDAVVHVRPEAEAAVRRRDRLLAVDGQAYDGRSVLERGILRHRPGETMRLGVSRDGVPGTAEVSLHRVEPAAGARLARSAMLVVGLLTPMAALLLGFGVAAVRPHDGRAWLLLLLMVSVSLVAAFNALDPAGMEGPLRPLAVAYGAGFGSSWPIWILLFGIYFPERLELDRRLPWLKWLIIAPIAAGAILQGTLSVLDSEDWRAGAALYARVAWVGRAPFLLGMLGVGLFFACMGYKAGTAQNPDSKRRLNLLLYGATLSLGPSFLLILGAFATGRVPFSETPPWLTLPAVMVMGFLPVTLAYVIVVHQAMDVRVVVRQGLQYALARRGVLVARIALSTGLILTAAFLAARPGTRRVTIVGLMGAAVFLVFLGQRAADLLLRWLDRRFFREAYDAEHVMGELAESVRTIVDPDRLLSTVNQRIADTLHVPRVAAFVRRNGSFAPAHALGPVPEPVAADDPLLAGLREGRPLRVKDGGAGRLREVRLLLPLAVKNRLLGFLALGERQAEAPYAPSDIRLLQSLAAQTALALENGQLTAQVARETALRARMDREVEIAREVQEGLFPQRRPEVPGLRYAGYCRPARGVGGDYYDVLELPGGLGVAVGDVSGKGIPAALLMACLQASLRAQALMAPAELGALMTRLNALLYDASPGNRYATLFYGHYDAASRRLAYVNAGHNEPVILRPDGSVARLPAGGPVVGLLPATAYEPGVVGLGPGDLLVGFTDGVSEAMNAADEEWGEESLIAALRGCAREEPDAVVKALMAGADRFAAGAPQHDDMTLIVLRAF
jgi:sigma-B regulation protein RsbU (phosphoserine phosphatase)